MHKTVIFCLLLLCIFSWTSNSVNRRRTKKSRGYYARLRNRPVRIEEQEPISLEEERDEMKKSFNQARQEETEQEQSEESEEMDTSSCVTFYEDCNYQGESFTACYGNYVSEEWTQRISSFQIGENVNFLDAKDESGDNREMFWGDQKCLDDIEWGDRIYYFDIDVIANVKSHSTWGR